MPIFPHSFLLSPADCTPEPEAPCGCTEEDCSPATHEGVRYCQACDEDLPQD
jgi:hypothetical protein